MSAFLTQLKWQFILLHKNSIITISFIVTLIYAAILFFLKDIGHIDKVLVALVLNDPSVIGYFFVALAVYTEMKHEILPAIFITPVKIRQFLVSRVLSLSVVGTLCSVGLALSAKGLSFDVATFTAGSLGICLLSALLGLIMLTFASEFLKFGMLSAPVFLGFVNIPLLNYLGAVDIGWLKYLFPVQGSLDLIDRAVSGTSISFWYSYLSSVVWILVFYKVAVRLFVIKVVKV